MAASTITIAAGELMHGITLRVRFMGVARARIWIAARVMRLAAWVAGCQVEVSIDGATDETEDARPPGGGSKVRG